MENINAADINDRHDIEKLIKIMIDDENSAEVAKSLAVGFSMNNAFLYILAYQ